MPGDILVEKKKASSISINFTKSSFDNNVGLNLHYLLSCARPGKAMTKTIGAWSEITILYRYRNGPKE